MNGRIVHLLRHGPPMRRGLLIGHTDEPAMHDGCPVMRERVAALRPSHIVASDLRRAAAQAAVLAQVLDRPLRLDRDWRELDFGAWEGLAVAQVDRQAMTRFWHDPDASPPPGGERWSAICERVRTALRRLEADTLVLTHAGAMRAALAVLTGLDHQGVWSLDLPYRALLSLRIWPAGSPGEPLAGHVVGLVTDADTGASP